jgi:Tannase and feruloyl esterase
MDKFWGVKTSRGLMRTVVVLCGMLLGLSSAAWSQPSQPSVEACTALANFQIPGMTLAFSKSERLAAGPMPALGPGPAAPSNVTLPAQCRVEGIIDRRQGAGGQTYGIGFALALPDNWNGRFLMQGGGGLNGRVAQPVGAAAAGDTPGLVRGFAVVSTDTGHQGAVFDASFMKDQQAALDFAYAANARVALLAKELIARYYGRPADRSYFAGCSTGGREGMVMSQRYPSYFDGIVAGAPAMRTGHSNLALRSMVAAISEIAPRDEQGRPVPAQAFSDGDRKTIIQGLLDACDANDGLKDGLIFDTRACRFDPAALACPGDKAEGCLSQPQIGAIKKAFAGPKDSSGRQVYPGFLYDTGITARQGIPGILSPGAGPPVPPPPGAGDVDREARFADSDAQAILTDTASWTNLATFAQRGGKLIFYHGVSDPWFSAVDTIDYYDRLGASNGGADHVQGWSRLFLSPGMGHCGGGQGAFDRFDMLSAVVDWVEKSVAPTAVVATSPAQPGRSRPLCTYPQVARYKGTGDPQDARSFECRP